MFLNICYTSIRTCSLLLHQTRNILPNLNNQSNYCVLSTISSHNPSVYCFYLPSVLNLAAWMETLGVKFPVKKAVSKSTPFMIPGMPNLMMHQSWPGDRRLRVSQPSIHLPQSVYKSALNTGSSSASKFSASANQSSVAKRIFPPS